MATNQQVKKIFNIGDVHIFNAKSFHVHEYVFNQFYKHLEQEKPDLIVITGDVIDSKIRLSPEQVSLCQNFFLNITNYAPVIMMLGNHDLALQNKERLDSISPVVYPLYNQTKHPIHFFKESGVYNAYGLSWAIWSCFSDQQNPLEADWNGGTHGENFKMHDYTIGLYHGAVKGCKAENGMVLSEGIDVNEFEFCNIVMMSDIHTGEKFRNNEVAYTGSFLQTKSNENPDGSFLMWEWNGKTYIPTTKRLSNIYSTVSYQVADATALPDFEEIKNDSQVISISYDPAKITKTEAAKIKKELTQKYNNKVEIKPLVKKKIKKPVGETKTIEEEKALNVREFFNAYILRNTHSLGVKDGDLIRLHDLDDKYMVDLDISKDFELGDFSINTITLNNFLSYPPHDTTFDLSKSGLYSIMAENTVGKSNVFTALKFAIFNSAPKVNSLKSLINNENKTKEASVTVAITKNGAQYIIKRTVVPKKADGVTTILDIAQVDDTGAIIRSLNKEKRQETEKEIEQLFGLESIFDILSFSAAQKKLVEFIDCKNAERLTLVNRFMGLQSFEQKDKVVADVLKTKNTVFKELMKDFNQSVDIEALKNTDEELVQQIGNKKNWVGEIQVVIANLEQENTSLTKQYNDTRVLASKRVDSPEQISGRIEELTTRIENQKQTKIEKEKKIEDYKKNLAIQKEDFYAQTGEDIKTFKPNVKVSKELENELAVNKAELKRLEKQANSDVCNSCGREYSEAEKQECRILIGKIEELNETIVEEISVAENDLSVILTLQSDYNNTGRIISTLLSDALDSQNKIINMENEREKLQNVTSEYDEVQKAKDLLAVLKVSYDAYLQEKKELESKIFNYSVDIKGDEEKLKTIRRDIKIYNDKFSKLQVLEDEIRVLKMYRSIIAKDGLPLYILKTKIDLINEQINLVVNQIFDYSVEFIIDEEAGDLDISFYYDEDSAKTDSGLASGAETFIMNLCIKVGLAQVSELPKADTLFIDEGFGTLDDKRIDKIPNLFNALNEFYRNIITVSHIDKLKDMAVHQIRLEKVGKYTKII